MKFPSFDGFRSNDTLPSEGEVHEKFWRTAKRAASHVHFMEEVVAAYYYALDKNIPLRVRGILLTALGYFILPVDTIPDVILGLNFIEDMAVLTATINAARANIPPALCFAAKEAPSQD